MGNNKTWKERRNSGSKKRKKEERLNSDNYIERKGRERNTKDYRGV